MLAVRLDNLGDVLMTTPALHAIRRSAPAARVTLLASGAGLAAVPHLADVDDAIAFDAPWMKVRERSPAPSPSDVAMIERLRERRFDAAIVFTCYTQSALPAALLCHLAGIPLRLAYSRENPYALLTDWVRETEPEQGVRHEVERQLALVAAVGFVADDMRLRFEVTAADRRTLAAKAAQCGLRFDRPWIVVHPGASAPSRRWPAERFGAAADLVAAATPCEIVFTGASDEMPLVDAARRQMHAPAANLAGRLALGELAALFARAAVVVTNNSGPAHVAAAVGVPVVDLYALTNPQHTPWGVPARVLNRDVPCRNCFKSVCPYGHQHCLTLVEPHEVAEATLALLAARTQEIAAATVVPTH